MLTFIMVKVMMGIAKCFKTTITHDESKIKNLDEEELGESSYAYVYENKVFSGVEEHHE